ncbi:MAG: penicillin-binding protein [Bacilli bacterium]|nr:penicillin-binding protein [Bacilli bacterium]
MNRRRIVNKVSINKLVFIIGLLLFCAIIARLIYLNLSPEIDGINLKKFANNRNTTKETLYATRGTIYDSNNEILAQTVDSYTLIAYLDKSRSKNQKKPQHVVDKDMTAEKLSPVIGMEKEKILEILNQKGLYQVEFGNKGRGLTQIQKEAIDNLKLPGIDFIATSRRYYPNLDFASYTLGYVQRDDETGEMNGEMGIELFYNKELTGTNGSLEYQTDANGYKLIDSPTSPVIQIDKIDGVDIYLTIDSNVQLIVERAFNTYFPSSGALNGGMVVADAKTGKILATTSRPSFDPNTKNIQSYLDPLISVAFEPGSTMKTYTYMCAIEKGTYKGEDTYASGKMQIADATIKDWNNYGWGQVSYDFGYMKSSNIGIANLFKNGYITKDDYRSYLEKLGFGKKTGIELPNEVSGKISFKYDVEVANAGFGQGIMTTPIQHIQALTSISNNGYILKPTIIEKIVDPNTKKTIYEYKDKKGTKVASENTVNKVKDLMYSVVNNPEGTGYSYRIDGYDIIGKTGTAEVVNPNTGRYYSSSYRSIKSFEGMYPKNNPKFIFYLYLDSPKYDNKTEMLKSILTDVETYYNITKVNTDSKNVFTMPNLINKSVENARGTLDSNSIKYEVIGNGTKIVNQYPKVNTIVNGRVFLITNDSNINIPNLNGYSRKDVINLMKLLNLNYNLEGNGYVVEYSVEVNQEAKPTKVNLKLSDKYQE